MADKKELLRKDISEAFDFVRFALKHPQTLKKIRNGSEIQFVPAASKSLPHPRWAKKVQTVTSETVFHFL